MASDPKRRYGVCTRCLLPESSLHSKMRCDKLPWPFLRHASGGPYLQSERPRQQIPWPKSWRALRKRSASYSLTRSVALFLHSVKSRKCRRACRRPESASGRSVPRGLISPLVQQSQTMTEGVRTIVSKQISDCPQLLRVAQKPLASIDASVRALDSRMA